MQEHTGAYSELRCLIGPRRINDIGANLSPLQGDHFHTVNIWGTPDGRRWQVDSVVNGDKNLYELYEES
jgi:hypothetical protein